MRLLSTSLRAASQSSARPIFPNALLNRVGKGHRVVLPLVCPLALAMMRRVQRQHRHAPIHQRLPEKGQHLVFVAAQTMQDENAWIDACRFRAHINARNALAFRPRQRQMQNIRFVARLRRFGRRYRLAALDRIRLPQSRPGRNLRLRHASHSQKRRRSQRRDIFKHDSLTLL